MRRQSRLVVLLGACALAAPIVLLQGAQQKIYWGDEVPPQWSGKWAAGLQTVAERSRFTRTITSQDNLEFITALRGASENLHVLTMFTSSLRKSAPAMVIANPRVTTPQQARASGKAVLFLFGNIHPPEPEAAEALLMVARDLAAGSKKNLLENLVVIIVPVFNVDGTDTLMPQDGSLGSETPHILGTRENTGGFDLNRDAVKLETVEANGMYRLLNQWDPVLLLDGHLMSRVNHGYANTYGTTTSACRGPGAARLYARQAVSGGARNGPQAIRSRSVHARVVRARRWWLATNVVEP